MEAAPIISQITIFPIKSLDGVSLSEAQVGMGGSLLHDREFAIIDSEGQFVNGKRNADVFSLRAKVDFDEASISFRKQEESEWHNFYPEQQTAAMHQWLSDYFGFPVRLIQNKEGRFLDIPDIAGITLLSTKTLESVSSWFGNLGLEETRKRFRATVEISHVPAFWEDYLFSEQGSAIEFQLGNVRLLGLSPRERCSVPTRNPANGEIIHGFPKIFSGKRATGLPKWSALHAYDHFYYLTVNCAIPPEETGKWIRIGDELRILGKKIL